jgi:hypothetical protein
MTALVLIADYVDCCIDCCIAGHISDYVMLCVIH